ncbi:ABC transporter ATP-binding protein [Demequina silvatica]|uniref:ABC transporter ATP-binding protein n=1 Tax=Demequina silvatica TaxID=1638988 RepID=UPI000780C409|nr:ATP-binding cassette domain-containing protein [Demequina silvatica]
MTISTARPDEVLRLEDVHMHFTSRRGPFGKPKTVKAVDGVSLHIDRGETLGLVGESGCGKSTLVRTILGLHTATSGRIYLDGWDLLRMPKPERRRARPRMQVVFQDPYTALDPRMTIHDLVAEPLRINGRYSGARVDELLDQVGFTREMAKRKPAEFSGGQRQRVGIARSLALNPDLLILDEPVSALDVSIQAQVINLLGDLQKEHRLAYLFIAHDLSVVRHLSDRVAVMYAGKLVEEGAVDDVFDRPQHVYTRTLLAAVPRPDPHLRPALT